MRNLVLTSLFFLFGSTLLHSQLPLIECTNGNEVCSGFSNENIAHFRVIAEPPIPLPSNAIFTYVWTAEHENGTIWTWHTSVSHRDIFIPWVGEYTVRVKILYVLKYKNYPFAAFWSNEVKIFGRQCIIQTKG